MERRRRRKERRNLGSKVVFARVDREGKPGYRCWVAREWWHEGEERIKKKKKEVGVSGKHISLILPLDLARKLPLAFTAGFLPTVQRADADKWDLKEIRKSRLSCRDKWDLLICWRKGLTLRISKGLLARKYLLPLVHVLMVDFWWLFSW